MKTKLATTVLLLPALISLLICTQSSAQETETSDTNLLRNPQFEQVEPDGMPTDWFRYHNLGYAATPDCYITTDTETFRVLPLSGGCNAAKIVRNGAVGSSLSQKDIPVEGGTTYLFSMRHKETRGFSANLYVCFRQYNQEREDITGNSYYFATNIEPGVEWCEFRKEITVKPDAAFLRLDIIPNGQGTCWIRDVQLSPQAAAAGTDE